MNDETKKSQPAKVSSLIHSTTLNQDIVMPVVTPEQALEAWESYEDLKRKIVRPEDTQLIEGNKFLKKSYWRKIATFFNLSTKVVSEKKEKIGKTYVWHFTVNAIAPNGRYAVGTGSCDAYEKATLKDGEYVRYNKWNKTYEKATPNSIHNIRTTAETRATNRAISNLVGGGEVSAEEITADEVKETKEVPFVPDVVDERV